MPHDKAALPTTSLTCDLGIQHTSCTTLAAEDRKALLKQVKAGEVTELEFDAIVFAAVYPNSNFLRFYDKDLSALANSFSGQPFLRNHDVGDIGSRDGTILQAHLVGNQIHQRIQLTSERGMLDFLQGRIDRFSIGWYFEDIDCSICQSRWMECNHWPGQHYKGAGKDDSEQTCELVFVTPRGKETSAVNAPAVKGTKVLDDHQPDDLAALIKAKQAYLKEGENRLTAASSAAPRIPLPPEPFDPLRDRPAPSQSIPPETTHKEPKMDPNDTAQAPAAQAPAAPPPTTPAPSTAAVNQAVTHVTVPVPIAPPVAQPTPQAATPPPALTANARNVVPPVDAPQPQFSEAAQTPAQTYAGAPAAASQTTPPDPQGALWLAAMREATITAMLAASGLPAAAQQVVHLAIGDSATDPAQVQKLIDAQRQAYAVQLDNQIVTGIKPVVAVGRVSGMVNDLDKFKVALFALFDNKRPANGLKPLAGLKEAYMLASGDYEMTGRFIGSEAQLANITSSSLPDMMAEWMNQRVVTIWQNYDRWYEQFCQIENFTSLRDPHWIKIGGIGELSTVGEGAAYTERDWIAASETAGWTKKGNWVGLTIEAIDRDTTGYIQQLPRALVQGAWLTISKDFTRRLKATNGAGYGYTMQSDTTALFHANHGNLGGSALSWSSWEATRLAMARQRELGTNEVLGGLTIPKTIMVPRHLENTAITLLATERVLGSGNNDINPLVVDGGSQEQRMVAARRMLVVNDFLDVANDWFAFADPQRFPLFGLGFRWGDSPEIFSVADPTSGLMFSNDVLPIKIRWYYSLGAIDHRGMYYHKVG